MQQAVGRLSRVAHRTVTSSYIYILYIDGAPRRRPARHEQNRRTQSGLRRHYERRINRDMHARDGEMLLDTLFHEELHRMFPYLGERAITCMTSILLPTPSQRYRSWLYSRISPPLKDGADAVAER